jgi:glycosyltransferase involved in cell wall biosynthesis
VVLEAAAAGVPSVVMKEGGPKFLIEHGRSGFIGDDDADFIETVVRLADEPQQLTAVAQAARRFALENSWQAVFEKIYEYYKIAMNYRKNIRAEQIAA